MNNSPCSGCSKALVATAWLAALTVFLLLFLGTLITTYRVGMVDPIWPTEPWYLFSQDWSEPAPGYFIEHTHRVLGYLAGFIILGMVSLALCRMPSFRWVNLALILGVSLGVGFAMTAVDRKAALADPIGAVNQFKLKTGLGLALLCALVLLFREVMQLQQKKRASCLELLALLSYLGVIVQGLLGGLRVYLNALVGPELAMVHGAMGQLVFALVAGTAVMAGTPSLLADLEDKDKKSLPRLGWILCLSFVIQLVWAVLVRHGGNPVAQRLHILGAFIIFGLVAWVSLRLAQSGRARPFFKKYNALLGMLVFLQVMLGIEAWMGKFGTGKPLAMEAINIGQASTRTIHAMVGALLLACSLGLALRLGQAGKTGSTCG